jgi:hypothetical protein
MEIQQLEDCEEACDGMNDDEIDEMLAESFPSIDPPSWAPGIDKHCESSKNKSKVEPMK